ncbi:hypothetical protein [Undibacterium sp.]|uniref:hypothetical protein n=1 Tax=Undibacterium sp. TaxID=1914977 RepID=UPI002C9BAE71|nr:hypothetical protein [Undibacterium sp.]HTD06195.1 hypothetical protein [Undibacterium sp.]
MKTAHKFQAATAIAGALVGAVFAAGYAFHNAAGARAAVEQVPTVTITAKRMTADEKLAYDMQQDGYAQTVVISARRLTAEQKQAMLEEELRLQNTVAKRAALAAQKAG